MFQITFLSSFRYSITIDDVVFVVDAGKVKEKVSLLFGIMYNTMVHDAKLTTSSRSFLSGSVEGIYIARGTSARRKTHAKARAKGGMDERDLGETRKRQTYPRKSSHALVSPQSRLARLTSHRLTPAY